ncbi:MAG: hypothetical protein PHX61_00500 [Alphaproteobacteria bacterium]|nr:hypothetical protein [Alphaproteobacteria bacterium]
MKKLNQLAVIGVMCASVVLMNVSQVRADSDWYWCDADKIVPSANVATHIRLRHEKILDSGDYQGSDFCTEDNPLNRMVSANILYNHLIRGDDAIAIKKSSALGKIVYGEWVRNGSPVYKTSQ